ncbi:hypothetical protein Dimus_013619 [Dionaea muscipula]
MQKQEIIKARTVKTSTVLPTNEENQPPQPLQESATFKEKGKGPVEIEPSCATGVPASTAEASTTTPSPPQNLKVSRNILDSVNQTPDARIMTSYAWVDEGLYPRDNEILLATDPRKLST